jgi:ATP-dependent RNA helicase SUPV3L1/SUV3
VLGPTNTGKTHLAVERLLAHGTGMIGLPLRLLAREIYDRMVKQKGERACALVTGEERIWPEGARYFACTVEAMPLSMDVDFLAVDEVQLAQDPDRGHVFTDRILHARGRHETMLLGADTMRQALKALDLDVDAERRERFSQLSYSGPIKITKLPKRSAIVAFSSEEVYAIAELLKRQRGGCAVVMGALSPRTRNAQVALYQSGEVDYIVATDAIGMGLNLDVDHVAFAAIRKFDGRHRRLLRPDELAQIAGRAGRFRDDGTFGETGDCEQLDEDTITRIVEHHFDPIEQLYWRNSALDFASPSKLLESLRRPTRHPVLRRAPEAIDETTLAALVENPDIITVARTPAHVRRLWDLCTLPDFRKAGADAHLRTVSSLVEKIIEPSARIKDEWMYNQVERLNRIEGDIDVLQQRLAEIRTWTYAANRSDWLENAATWQGRTREIEDKLSDALHERLMQRFVDRRTSALLKTLNSEEDTPAELGPDNAVLIGGHRVGRLDGLKFTPDAASSGQTLEGRALRNAALKALRPVIERRLMDLERTGDADLSLAEAVDDPRHPIEIVHAGAPVARLKPSSDWLRPRIDLLGAVDAHTGLREQAEARLAGWLENHIRQTLLPLFTVREAIDGGRLRGLSRGVAFQLVETGAALDLRIHGPDQPQAQLGPADRRALKEAGVSSGRLAAFLPGLLRPAPAQLAILLRSVHASLAPLRAPTASSFKVEGWHNALLWSAGYIRLGPRAVRADMAERLSFALTQARRASDTATFTAPPELAALIGCPLVEFQDVLRAMGLKPAERDAETKPVTRWRFPSRRPPPAPKPDAPPPATGPFAALAQLRIAANEPKPAHRKRRRKRKPASKPPAAAE